MLTKCQIRLRGACSTSISAVNMVGLFFETTPRHGVAGCAGRQPTRLQLGPCRSAMANDGSTRPAPIDPPKLVEERERVVENQRLILGILGRLMFSLRDVSLAWLVLDGADRNRKTGGAWWCKSCLGMARNGQRCAQSHLVSGLD